ncbi:hypothetical protein E6C76_13705 [Pseudothauera nasutitermitis]|uniref:ATP-grasp domain-containing protein n=1 Tax=Pseudothauera nasutitermitis TaxID=2565930 RepID=A0A4V3WBK9_9RHOO|nr:hypothetical protein [Pseudothauera nasutitermitis]THF63643.1 hypothetical protein E6C76_13705 [Pseudothauera nasutitermitis]
MVPPHQTPTPAVVIGLCAHGLGLVRDLARAGVPVIGLEANAGLPGMRSRYGDFRLIPDINGPALLDSLDDLADTLPAGIRPVLILTNDRMVRTVGEAAARVARRYRLSWAASAERLLPLLNKDAIEARCLATGLAYPASRLVTGLDALANAAGELGFPVIAKPVQPLSALKTLVAASADELAAASTQLRECLPLLLQTYIPGGDERVRFGALYLDHGRIVARFEGRKLHSRPLGHTTIALSEPDDAIHELTRRFFDGLALSGPVSLEVKHAPDGSPWVIEPTVGRTDFWSSLCSANGVNLALIEYRCTLGQPIPPATQSGSRVWINGERFPAALPWLARHAPQALRQGARGVYLDLRDPMPFLASAALALGALPQRAGRKLRKLLAN